MTEQLMEIGIRLRALREISAISPADMAKAVNISLEEYEKHEKGKKDFSFSFLFNAARILGVEVMDIISGSSPKLSACSIVRAGCGYSVERNKAYKYMALAHTFNEKRAEPFLVTVEPGVMPELSAHEGQEFQYLLEGEACMVIGENTYTLYPGDSVYFDSSIPHSMGARNGERAHFLAVVIK
ncbi:MAG TPA: XRE family transcriptional regulator [Clostridia bacterium]|nr:XRE family transcriptional regulator [Clostridia bacterium]HOR12767.1 XRE family transcriptional regulator [Clostridia bacterium]